MACRSTAPLDDRALRDTITYAFAALLPGAAVELAVHQERAADVDRILLEAGFVFDQPAVESERGPLPSIFELPFAPGELQREMAAAAARSPFWCGPSSPSTSRRTRGGSNGGRSSTSTASTCST